MRSPSDRPAASVPALLLALVAVAIVALTATAPPSLAAEPPATPTPAGAAGAAGAADAPAPRRHLKRLAPVPGLSELYRYSDDELLEYAQAVADEIAGTEPPPGVEPRYEGPAPSTLRLEDRYLALADDLFATDDRRITIHLALAIALHSDGRLADAADYALTALDEMERSATPRPGRARACHLLANTFETLDQPLLAAAFAILEAAWLRHEGAGVEEVEAARDRIRAAIAAFEEADAPRPRQQAQELRALARVSAGLMPAGDFIALLLARAPGYWTEEQFADLLGERTSLVPYSAYRAAKLGAPPAELPHDLLELALYRHVLRRLPDPTRWPGELLFFANIPAERDPGMVEEIKYARFRIGDWDRRPPHRPAPTGLPVTAAAELEDEATLAWRETFTERFLWSIMSPLGDLDAAPAADGTPAHGEADPTDDLATPDAAQPE